jgi:putative CocE/NonD family hydrolase
MMSIRMGKVMKRAVVRRVAHWPISVGLFAALVLVACQTQPTPGSGEADVAQYIRDNFAKREVQIPMRDGAKLFTAIYTPRDTRRSYPILMRRTPYSVGPYGADSYPSSLGPNESIMRDGYIFVLQDVRGRFMSEGEFVNMTPHVSDKQTARDIDESTDTYDTIEWLLANVPNHNGNVGMWGISYQGFYAAAGMIAAHPALKAVSPQAPIADWWYDDFHHHGAFFLPHSFNFFAVFGLPRPAPTTEWGPRFEHGTPDGYQWFLDLGPLQNVEDRYFRGRIKFWTEATRHPNYDSFWQSRNILPHLHDVAPAVMTVGGWFDAEDLYGALNIYRSIEEKNPGVFNILVMGPWRHGGWARDDGDSLGNIHFGSTTSLFYRENIESRFFKHFLKGEGELDLPEAYVFETGANRWRTFADWPPTGLDVGYLYLGEDFSLTLGSPNSAVEAWDEYVSDPSKPVPYTQDIDIGMTREYMTDDQRFAARRPDVLAYQTEALDEDVTLAGPVMADLWVSTSGTASDWVVKLIDVFPDDASDPEGLPRGTRMGGYQMMVRSEVIRGRFRNSPERPEPFVPDSVINVVLPLQDVLHTFKSGHRIMVQIQSTWFPLVDRNPQKYVDNIFTAEADDFMRATQRVYRSRRHPSRLRVGVLPQ